MTPDLAAQHVVRLLERRAPTLARTRLVCIDGPAGSGKTTLAAAVATAASGRVALLHMDDLYEGWTGLERDVGARVRGILEPLAAGRPGRYRRYDWVAGRFAEEHTVPPADLLVLEGVGSAAAGHDALVTVRVWVEAPPPLRLERGIARDGEATRAQWLAWGESESRHFAADRTRERADLVVDGTGRRVPVPGPRRGACPARHE